MIVKGSTVAVYFYVTDTSGFPATGKAASISGSYVPNGLWAARLSLTRVPISEVDSFDCPGWYVFQYTFNDVGTAFFVFQCTDCIIAPWEEQVVDMDFGILKDIKSGILHWSVSSNTLTLYDSSNNSLGTYTLTRDSSGNIIAVTPN